MSRILFSGLTALLFSFDCSSQSAVKLLQAAQKKCESVNHGSYVMQASVKYPMGSDTVVSSSKCRFIKEEKDTLFSSYFIADEKFEDSSMITYAYSGNEFVRFHSSSSKAVIMPVKSQSDLISDYAHNYKFFHPLVQSGKSLFPVTDTLNTIYSITGTENVSNNICTHISITEHEDGASGMLLSGLDVWINTEDSVPVKYAVRYMFLLNNDTLIQNESYTLLEYEINQKDFALENIYSLIPGNYQINEYAPVAVNELLRMGSKAPEWQVETVTGDLLSANDLKGKVVLFDFFFQSCYPCIKALPFLEKLYDKYSGKDFVIIGVDNAPGDKEKFDDFTLKHKLQYPVVIDDLVIQELFKVNTFPTFYLLNKSGEIIYAGEGFSEEEFGKLEELITKELDKQ